MKCLTDSNVIGGFTANAHEFGFGQAGEHYNFVSLPFIRILWNGGNASVVLFFIISGYVLSIGHLKKIRNGDPATGRTLLSAIIRRPMRLYLPPLVVSLLFALLLHVPGPLVLPLPWMKPQEGGILAEVVFFTKTSWMYFNPFQVHEANLFWYPYNVVMWTIPIELKGSMLVFAVLALFSGLLLSGHHNTRAPAILATGVFCISAVMLFKCWKWSMSCFLLGIVLSMLDVWELDEALLARFSSRTRAISMWTIFVLAWYLISQPAHKGDIKFSSETPGWIWLTKMLPSGYNDDLYFRFWQVWGSLILIYAILRLPPLQRLLSMRPVLFCGEVSFMLYLIHIPILRIFGDRLPGLFGGTTPSDLEGTFWDKSLPIPDIGPLGLSLRFLLCVAIVLPLCLLVAKYATEHLDKPIVRLGRRITTNLRLEKKAAAGVKTTSEDLLLPMSIRS